MRAFLDCHSPDSLSPARDTQCRSRVAQMIRRGKMAAPDAREREMMSSEDSRSQDTSQRQVPAEVMISRRCGGLSMRVAGGDRRELRMEHIRGVAAVRATSRAGATRAGDAETETRKRRRGDGDAETKTRRRRMWQRRPRPPSGRDSLSRANLLPGGWEVCRPTRGSGEMRAGALFLRAGEGPSHDVAPRHHLAGWRAERESGGVSRSRRTGIPKQPANQGRPVMTSRRGP